MIFTADMMTLSKACRDVSSAGTMKTTNVYTECLRIRTIDGASVEISAYNLTGGAKTVVPAFISEEGDVIVKAKTLCDMLVKFRETDVKFTSDANNICTVSCGTIKYNMAGFSSLKYPEVPERITTPLFTVKCGVLREMIKRSVFSVSNDEIRTVHRGEKFELTAGTLTMIAVDGFRLSVRKEQIEYDGEDVEFIVPGRALRDISRLMSDDDTDVTVSIDNNCVVFEIGDYTAFSDLLKGGKFMNYKSSIPTGNKYDCFVETEKMLLCVENAAVVISDSGDNKGPVRCTFRPDTLMITSDTNTGDAGFDSIPVSFSGDGLEIFFNSRYLTDALGACDTDSVKLELNGETNPMLIKPVQGDSFLYMILPVRPKQA